MTFVRNNLPDFPSLPKYRISGQLTGALEIQSVEGEIVTFADKRFPPAKGDSWLFRFRPVSGDWYVMFEDGEKRFVRKSIFDVHYIRSADMDPDKAHEIQTAHIAQQYKPPT